MPGTSDQRHALVADIGGTNTRIGLASGTQIVPNSVTRYRNADHVGLEDVIRHYMADNNIVECTAACVAIAGPVRDGVGALTNLDWALDTDTLSHAARCKQSFLINDLQAQGYALANLDDACLQEIIPGKIMGNRARLVIGVGTGFNVAPVVPVPFGPANAVIAPAAEHGHILLPQHTQSDTDLVQHLRKQRSFVSVEDVLSGRGLERVYAFHALATNGPNRNAAEIMAAAAQDDPIALATVADVLRVLGTVAGDLALAHLPFDGLYLVGGVSRALGPYLKSGTFAAAFTDKGRFSDFMSNFSVLLVEDDYAALSGAAAFIDLCEKN